MQPGTGKARGAGGRLSLVERAPSRPGPPGSPRQGKPDPWLGPRLEAIRERPAGYGRGRSDRTACADGATLGDGIVGEQAGEAPGKGADPTERRLAEGKAQEIIGGRPMLYTVPVNVRATNAIYCPR